MAAVQNSGEHWLHDHAARILFPDPRHDSKTHSDIEGAWERAGGVQWQAPGKALAELSFGFWVLLTARRHETLIWDQYLKVLYPRGSNRHQIHRGLDELRKARNRVAHHEPISTAQANILNRQINRYARYVSPELAAYITDTSGVIKLVNSWPKV